MNVCFVDNTEDYEAEVRNFLQGYYNSDLGNTMPLAMGNALHVSFVIFTSLSSSPVFFVTPSSHQTIPYT